MSISYFKRFKMTVPLHGLPPVPELPPGYAWTEWDDSLLEAHADVQFRAFCTEMDSTLFPSLGEPNGCRFLMHEIRRKAGFIPAATWLIACRYGYCATVQGIMDSHAQGAIQNIGVTLPHRGQGLGQALLLKALHGFRQCGLTRASLEVTADNRPALRLYHRLGFRRMKTLYRAVDI